MYLHHTCPVQQQNHPASPHPRPNHQIVSAGNEATVTHWTRPGLVPSARVTISDLPSVFAVNARAGPPQGDGVTVYAGRSDAVSVFINPENKAFDLKFR